MEGASREVGRLPAVKVEASEVDVISIRLAKAGYWAGNPEAVKDAPSDEVMRAWHYEQFVNDYERTWWNLNRESPK